MAAEDEVVVPLSCDARVSSEFNEAAGYGRVLLPGACEADEVTSPDRAALTASPLRVEDASMVVVADAVSVADTTLVSATIADSVVVEAREPLPAKLSSPRAADGAVVLPRQEVAELLPKNHPKNTR